MYVDERLVEELKYHSLNQIHKGNIEDYLKEKCVFYTLEEAKNDQELETIEEVMKSFFIIVDGNHVRFVGDDVIDEWF